jgi:hypothetical protein
MSVTILSDVSNQIQKFWSPIFVDKLKEDTLLPSLCSREYEGEIRQGGDTVYVSAIARPSAVRKGVSDVDADVYSSNKLSTTRVSIAADTIIETGVEIFDLVDLQSQIGAQQSKIRQVLFESLEIELNNYLYSKVSPSSSSPDMITNGVTDFNGSQLGALRVAASQQKWMKGERYLLLDPQYYQDLLNVAALTSNDYAPETPVVGGQFALQRFGFQIFEDNSAGMAQVSPTSATSDLALAFSPDFLYLVMQRSVTFKLSDLHAQKRRGYFLSAEMVVGAAQGIEGNVKHATVYNT